ncbi:NUDIX domain-containing protein, partial [Streptomyces bobili]|uniref:NUDIX domain-containing protein n=1 Tax=Streptomyces bobili TaxID=67280 RepID=UPI0034444D6D
MDTTRRRAARVVCLDTARRVLPLRWRDPFDGNLLWEPPGGGAEPGGTPLEAARRELAEQTGLDPAAVVDRWMPVHRDVWWKGKRYVGTEHFSLAPFPDERPALLPDERTALDTRRWVAWPELRSLPDPV